jgi:hypothetical protein
MTKGQRRALKGQVKKLIRVLRIRCLKRLNGCSRSSRKYYSFTLYY